MAEKRPKNGSRALSDQRASMKVYMFIVSVSTLRLRINRRFSFFGTDDTSRLIDALELSVL